MMEIKPRLDFSVIRDEIMGSSDTVVLIPEMIYLPDTKPNQANHCLFICFFDMSMQKRVSNPKIGSTRRLEWQRSTKSGKSKAVLVAAGAVRLG